MSLMTLQVEALPCKLISYKEQEKGHWRTISEASWTGEHKTSSTSCILLHERTQLEGTKEWEFTCVFPQHRENHLFCCGHRED